MIRPIPRHRPQPTRGLPRRPHRAFTLAEMLIAVVIGSMVMAAVAGLFYLSARTLKEVDAQAWMRAARLSALDALRYRLMDARIGSCTVSDGGRRIEFNDPNHGTAVSAFYFDAESNTLYYDEDVDDAVEAVAVTRGPIDITFELQQAGAIVRIRVKTASYLAYADVDRQDGETAVYLRNI